VSSHHIRALCYLSWTASQQCNPVCCTCLQMITPLTSTADLLSGRYIVRPSADGSGPGTIITHRLGGASLYSRASTGGGSASARGGGSVGASGWLAPETASEPQGGSHGRPDTTDEGSVSSGCLWRAEWITCHPPACILFGCVGYPYTLVYSCCGRGADGVVVSSGFGGHCHQVLLQSPEASVIIGSARSH
jgi:hypothetical protein